MNSFNAFGQTDKEFGGNVPVWLGTVKPIPAGATFTAEKGKVYRICVDGEFTQCTVKIQEYKGDGSAPDSDTADENGETADGGEQDLEEGTAQ
jgi:hypothetical protein